MRAAAKKFFGVEALHNVWQATAPSQTARPPASALIVHRHSDRPGLTTSRNRTSIAKYRDIEEFPSQRGYQSKVGRNRAIISCNHNVSTSQGKPWSVHYRRAYSMSKKFDESRFRQKHE